MLESLAEAYLKHAEKNGGKCQRSFMKNLVVKAKEIAKSLELTRNDIKNKADRDKKAQEQKAEEETNTRHAS